MPERDPGLLIGDMLGAAQKIDRYLVGLDRQSFLEDEKTVDAVVRNLEIIGEAARRLPSAYTAQHPDLPWHQMAGLRNRIVHDYAGLDVEIVWDV
ncbi:MAG: DUF86 domain-containing protein, partial [Candidatus Latescibacterota bacterium]